MFFPSSVYPFFKFKWVSFGRNEGLVREITWGHMHRGYSSEISQDTTSDCQLSRAFTDSGRYCI